MTEADSRDELSWDLLRDMTSRSANAERRETLGWMIDVLEGWLGPEWPNRVTRSESNLRSMVVGMTGYVAALATWLELALRVQRFEGASGMVKLRKMANDLTLGRFLHVRAALEIGALAEGICTAIAFEPELGPAVVGPGDVRLTFVDRAPLDIEVRVLLASERWRVVYDWGEQLRDVTMAQSYEHRVRFTIDASSIQDAVQYEDLVRAIEDIAVAANASRSNTRTVLESGATVAAELVDEPTPFHDISYPPYFEEDGLRRLRGALRDKAEKYVDCRPVWIRLDVLDGLLALSPWAQDPVGVQLAAISAAIRDVLSGSPGAAGVVMSSAGTSHDSGPDDDNATVEGVEHSVAVSRRLPLLRRRNTFIVPLHEKAVADVALWRSMYEKEPQWLPDMLQAAGLPTVDQINPRSN